MEFEDIPIISGMIKTEKLTSNYIFTLKARGLYLDDTAIRLSDCLFSLMKMLSASGFNTEIEEPTTINLIREDMKDKLLDDILLYLGLLNHENKKLRSLIIIILEIKILLLKLIQIEMNREMKTISLIELGSYNGRDGRPAFAAVDDLVYDVTNSPVWMDGTHFGLLPGRDLTNEFSGCHSMNREVLNKLPVIGRLVRG